ncbi:epsilon-sarcoglycan isoform X2 [Sitodiplosis mosellana]|uniref:epsilon-sarcoglycan isoform X2 n=1 Tax=Sitodiplosis mosellana TaxID=263140 RepID=UPI0024451FD9|nr:epsilon-sarcoglycan isoform X2 [Sitodiplosis mosellana]
MKNYRVSVVLILAVFKLANGDLSVSLGRANVNEWFSKKIEPQMFNLTLEQPDQFEYSFSLKNYPDLPTWMRFMYSTEYNSGFLYGTPPEQLGGREIHLDVVALNKLNYNIEHAVLSLYIARKTTYAVNTVQMKIDNLNWVHLTDPGRVENLKNIFTFDLWPESKNDLHISFMESAVNMGGRVPVQPQQKEGIIVHLSSHTAFSQRLIDLQEEVKPLYKISTCTYKRTSVQTIFENAGFKLDWCAFHIVNDDSKSAKKAHHTEHKPREQEPLWDSMSMYEIPQRTYIDEFAFAIALPGVLLAILVAILSVVLCFQHEKFVQRPHGPGHTVQVVQYADNHPTTSLKSIKDVNTLVDNVSLTSNSPNNSLYRANNAAASTLRPKPPPYKPKNLQYNGAHI